MHGCDDATDFDRLVLAAPGINVEPPDRHAQPKAGPGLDSRGHPPSE